MPADDNFREHYGWVTTPDEGKAVAKTTARRIERSKKKVELLMAGTVAPLAGAIGILEEFRPQMNGRYKIIVVRHNFSRNNWTTAITCEGGE